MGKEPGHKTISPIRDTWRDATGIAVCSNNGIEIFKRACSASDFISTSEYAEVFNNRNIEKKLSSGIAIIGHTRLATNGNPFNPSNNQPIFFGDIVIAHNGITPREEKVWSSFDIEATNFSSDTLGLAVALQKTNDKSETLGEAVKLLYASLSSEASTISTALNTDEVVFATNTGSLYFCELDDNHVVVVASEKTSVEAIIAENKHLTTSRSKKGRSKNTKNGPLFIGTEEQKFGESE